MISDNSYRLVALNPLRISDNRNIYSLAQIYIILLSIYYV